MPAVAADPEEIARRLERLPGLDHVRAAARAAGVDAFLVGGSVRDLLLEGERVDLDVAIEGDPAAVAKRLGGEVRVHERFATAHVRFDGHVVDLARTRTETYSRPGALPEVRPASLADDLARRDFTVNAMALPLQGEPTLIDLHGGLSDLRARTIRVLHDRSISDDPTRTLRAARYAARLALEPDADTLGQLRSTDLGTVSAERAEAELRLLAGEERAREGFELLHRWGILTLPSGAAELIEKVAALSGLPEWSELECRADAILAVARGANGDWRELAAADPPTPSRGARLARGHGPVDLLLARAAGASWLDRYLSEWRHTRLEITGRDLLAAGVPEGPAIGRGLGAALDAKLDHAISGREQEMAAALAALRDEGA